MDTAYDGMGVGAYHGWRLGIGAGPAARGDNPLTAHGRTLLIQISCYLQEGRVIESREAGRHSRKQCHIFQFNLVWGQKLNGQSSGSHKDWKQEKRRWKARLERLGSCFHIEQIFKFPIHSFQENKRYIVFL